MKLYNLTIMLLMLDVLISEGIPYDETDNAIEVNEPQRPQLDKNWVKLTKTPPFKVFQKLETPVEIVCEVMGSQIPTIQWFVGHLPLSEIESIETNQISEVSMTAIVRVQSVHIIEHMLTVPQIYTCVGRTGSKTVFASTTVYPHADLKALAGIKDQHIFLSQKPKIVYSEKLHLDIIGSDIQIPCRVHSNIPTDIRWMNGDGKIIEQNNHFKVLPSGDLFISEIKWEDMGVYKCIARNSFGKDNSDTFIYPVLKEDK